MYPSGITDTPKGVLLSHANIIANAMGLSAALDWRENDRYLAVTPLFHITGIILDLVSILQRSSVIYMADFHPQYIWHIIAQEQITHFMSSPTILRMMLDVPVWVQKITASLAPHKVIEQYRAMKLPIIQVYSCKRGRKT